MNLRDVPVIFHHAPAANPEYVKDIITTDNFIDAQVGQFTGFLTYGLTNRLDVSVAMPIMSVNMAVTSHAVIQRIGTGADTDIHTFGTPNGGTEKTFSDSGSASGIGDVIARVKGTAVKWNGGGIAGVFDLRLPTGDEYNFLGSGALGVRGFVVASGQLGPVSPHANVGYEWNGDSVLAGNVSAGIKAKLPGAFEVRGEIMMKKNEAERDPKVIADRRAELLQKLQYLELELGDKPYMLGEFSLVDIDIFPRFPRMESFGVIPSPILPRLNAWYKRIGEQTLKTADFVTLLQKLTDRKLTKNPLFNSSFEEAEKLTKQSYHLQKAKC